MVTLRSDDFVGVIGSVLARFRVGVPFTFDAATDQTIQIMDITTQ